MIKNIDGFVLHNIVASGTKGSNMGTQAQVRDARPGLLVGWVACAGCPLSLSAPRWSLLLAPSLALSLTC